MLFDFEDTDQETAIRSISIWTFSGAACCKLILTNMAAFNTPGMRRTASELIGPTWFSAKKVYDVNCSQRASQLPKAPATPQWRPKYNCCSPRSCRKALRHSRPSKNTGTPLRQNCESTRRNILRRSPTSRYRRRRPRTYYPRRKTCLQSLRDRVCRSSPPRLAKWSRTFRASASTTSHTQETYGEMAGYWSQEAKAALYKPST